MDICCEQSYEKHSSLERRKTLKGMRKLDNLAEIIIAKLEIK